MRSASRRERAISPCARSACSRSRLVLACSTSPGLRAATERYRRTASPSCRRALLVPRSAPLMDCCNRSRRAPSSLSRSSSSWWRTLAVERRNFSEGKPVISATTVSTWPGSVMVWPPISSSTVPFWPANRLARRPVAPSCSNSISTNGSSDAPHVRASSISRAVEVALRNRAISIAAWTVDLPASLGPRMTVRPAAGWISRSRWRRIPWTRRRVIFTVRPGPRVGDRRSAADPAGAPRAPPRRHPRHRSPRRP